MLSTTPRTIMRDPAILGGRWHLSGSSVAIAEIRLDHTARGTTPDYTYPGVTAEELAAALAWDFPPIREAAFSLLTGVGVIACLCGEDTAVAGTLEEPVRCVCGRTWQLRVLLELAEAALLERVAG
jgi:uncharacterized protein (DUF433 family)